jgi:glycine oxidase
MEPDVVVVGNGIVGAAVALRLAASGRRVVSVDIADPVGSATCASGAMLGVLGELTPSEDHAGLALRLDAWKLHPSWWDEIGLAPPAAGTFVVAGPDRPHDLAALCAMEAAAADHGLRAERVEPQAVPELAPAPGHWPVTALFLADEAWVDGPALRRQVIAAGIRLGMVAIADSVEAIRHADGAVTGVLLRGGDTIACGEAVLCTGAAVPALLRASGLDDSLIPAIVAAKGVGLLLEGRQGPGYQHVLRTPNRQFACGLHVVPRGEHDVYVGSTNRAGSRLPGISGRVTAGEAGQLLTDITRELASPLNDWDITAMMYGRRPMPLDGMPVAGRTELDGLSVATGTYRNGVLLAPLIADAVHADLDGRGPPELSLRRPVPDVDTVAVLRQGLSELVDHWRYDAGARWHERLSPLLDEMARLAFEDGPVADARRRQAVSLLRGSGRPEMVPEAIIELLDNTANHNQTEKLR